MLPGKEKTQYGFHLLGFCSGGVLLIDSQNSLCSLATLASLTVYPPAFLHGVFTRSRCSPATLAALNRLSSTIPIGSISSACGRGRQVINSEM